MLRSTKNTIAMSKVKYKITEVGETFVYGRLSIDSAFDIYNSITEEVDDYDLTAATIGSDADDDDQIYPETRSSSIHWIKKAKKARKLTTKLVKKINEEYFDIDFDYAPDWQWTVYSDPDDHYTWHKDEDEEDPCEDFIRNISISICMSASELYEGAEFFIKDGSETNIRVFKMGFGEFIIFPSEIEHRVNSLREGERESLVVWFGNDL